MSPPPVHPAAAVGFGGAVDAYVRGRPDYPPAAVERVVDLVRSGPGGALLDLAAGTGILTAALVSAGLDPIAAEPLGPMRDRLSRSLPGVRVLAAVAEALPFAGGSIGAVTVAQAFHWFDGRRAVAELGRVMAPGAPVIVVFNVRDRRDASNAALDDIWRPYRGDTPTHRSGAWRSAFVDQDEFGPLERASVRHEQTLDVEGLVDRVVSVSFIAAQRDAERADVADRVRSLAGDRSSVTLPYRTDIWWTVRRV